MPLISGRSSGKSVICRALANEEDSNEFFQAPFHRETTVLPSNDLIREETEQEVTIGSNKTQINSLTSQFVEQPQNLLTDEERPLNQIDLELDFNIKEVSSQNLATFLQDLAANPWSSIDFY